MKFHEINPKQDFASSCKEQLGNMVKIPLSGKSHFPDWREGWEEIDPVEALENTSPIESQEFESVCVQLGADLTAPEKPNRVGPDTNGALKCNGDDLDELPDDYVLDLCRDSFENFARNWQGGFNAADRSPPFFSVLTGLVKVCGQRRGQIERIIRSSDGWRGFLADREGKDKRFLEGEFDRAIAKNGEHDKAKSAASGSKDAANGRPKIWADNQSLGEITKQTLHAIHLSNQPPRFFRHGGLPARIELDDHGEPTFRMLNDDRMRHEAARAAYFYRVKKDGRGKDAEKVETEAMPPKAVIADVLATPNIAFPIVERVVEAPVFAQDGTLQTRPGYHHRGRVYYHPAPGFCVPDVTVKPTRAEVAEAVGLIGDELLGDFPFVTDAEKAHAIGLLLLPFARDLIAGPTPLHLVEKPTPGSGATLMTDILAFPATGRPLPTLTEGRDEEEWRKRITAKLRTSPTHTLIDNLRRRLDSAAVSSAITSPTWEDRILGKTENVRIPVRCCWVATGNNPAVSSEISRRCIRIRIDPKQDRPWLRSRFRHPNLRQWARDNRPRLVWAALTIIRDWIVAGRPHGGLELGMFESWSGTIGGILDVAGVPGFLSNLGEFYDAADTEAELWRTFIASWWQRHSDFEVSVADLYRSLVDDEEFELELGDGNQQSRRIRLGKQLSRMRDRVFHIKIVPETDDDDAPTGECPREYRVRLVRGQMKKRAYLWKLQEMGRG